MNRIFRFSGLLAALLCLGPLTALHAQTAPSTGPIQPIKVKTKPGKKDELVTIHVTQGDVALGDIKILLYDQTPQHKANFLQKAKSGFYNGTTFHRVIPNFMVQGGDANSKNDDPNDDGLGQPSDPTIPAEIVPELKHQRGAVAAARQGDYVNPQRASSSSQFYIVQNVTGTPHLDNHYTVFGLVVQGQAVVDKIVAVPITGPDRPVTPVRMKFEVKKLSKKKIMQEYGFQY
ncbi:peptidylprolyl isomerase [Hymenobacter edaphi]|uniref:Peptidyl-prolyl cis-trans isomerase n=1 Tax=Hymenobacter edaphi TaxID=2211146 RepID=A0A328BLS8_9BACT|nr:peptidylprolyl isomerase [Hymenobacter edaphi]RAK66936.1 peptidylprolyl isomerase [Hymenobacter edaphi]